MKTNIKPTCSHFENTLESNTFSSSCVTISCEECDSWQVKHITSRRISSSILFILQSYRHDEVRLTKSAATCTIKFHCLTKSYFDKAVQTCNDKKAEHCHALWLLRRRQRVGVWKRTRCGLQDTTAADLGDGTIKGTNRPTMHICGSQNDLIIGAKRQHLYLRISVRNLSDNWIAYHVERLLISYFPGTAFFPILIGSCVHF